MKKIALFTLLLFCATLVTAQNESPLINTPSLSPKGDQMAFSYQGDIWIADIDGSNARRLTIHEGYESKPLWSADGLQIIFQSDRNGNRDVFVMAAHGGLTKQITFHSTGDSPTDVTTSGNVLFNTSRAYKQIEWNGEMYQGNLSGGTPSRLLSALGSNAVQSPNGRFIAFVIGSCRYAREAYDGAASSDIWLYDSQNDNYTQLTTHAVNDIYPRWGNDQTLYFQSSRSGRYNIHKLNLDENGSVSGAIDQITNFTDMGITSFQVSRNGKLLILDKGDQVFTVESATNVQTEVNIFIGADYRYDPIVQKSYSGKVEQIVPSPNGKFSALVIRGEIFVIENDKEKDQTVNVSNSSFREMEPQWVNDSTLIFLSDRGGKYDIYAVSSTDPTESNLMKSLKRDILKVT